MFCRLAKIVRIHEKREKKCLQHTCFGSGSGSTEEERQAPKCVFPLACDVFILYSTKEKEEKEENSCTSTPRIMAEREEKAVDRTETQEHYWSGRRARLLVVVLSILCTISLASIIIAIVDYDAIACAPESKLFSVPAYLLIVGAGSFGLHVLAFCVLIYTTYTAIFACWVLCYCIWMLVWIIVGFEFLDMLYGYVCSATAPHVWNMLCVWTYGYLVAFILIMGYGMWRWIESQDNGEWDED